MSAEVSQVSAKPDLPTALDTIAKLRKAHGKDLKIAKARRVKRRTGPATYAVRYVFMARRTVDLS